jgi:probable rRNA maturation factor
MADPGGPSGVEAGDELTVVVSDEQGEVDVDADRWGRLAAAALRAERRRGELTLTFVDRAEMTLLNIEHMGEPGPTDVLSFPLDALDPDRAEPRPTIGPVLLGDVVICPSVAAEAAPRHAGTLDDELALLTIHGVLHVLGHDHVDREQTETMRRRELELLIDHHWCGPAPAGFEHQQGPA